MVPHNLSISCQAKRSELFAEKLTSMDRKDELPFTSLLSLAPLILPP